nr:thioredoxin domain-containing protein [Gordonia humi]
MFKIGAAVVLIAIAAGVGIWAVVSNKDSNSDSVIGKAVPTTVTDGAIRITNAPAGTDPKAVVTIAEDFQCPACGSFEKMYGETVQKLTDNPNVAVDYIPMNFLDRNFGNKYSLTTANASQCVAESTAKNGDFGVWIKFHNLLFANQMAEGTEGFTNDQLVDFAKQAGATDVSKCITGLDYGQYIIDQTDKILNDKAFTGTPWVRLNGETMNLSGMSPADLTAAVNAAAK